MSNINERVFYNAEENRVSFEDLRFYRCADNKAKFVPSVTTILNVAPKGAHFYEWLKKTGKDADTYMAERMERGSLVHRLTEQYDLTGEVELSDGRGNFDMAADVCEMIHRYDNFITRFTPQWESIERAYGHSDLGFGGTLDRVGKIAGDRWLIDIKTGYEYDYYKQQQAAYLKMHNFFNPDEQIDRVGILYLDTDHRTEGKKGSIQGIGWCMREIPMDTIEYHWEMFNHYWATWKHAYPNWEPNSKLFSTKIVRPYEMARFPRPVVNGPDDAPIAETE